MRSIRAVKDVYKVFDDGFQRLARLDEIGFQSSFRLVMDLTRVAAYADFKQGVLVAEVLEGVLSQIGHLFEAYEIPAGERAEITRAISRQASLLSSVYRSDGSATYEILSDMRFAATKFQFKCMTTWPPSTRQLHARSGADA